MQSSTKRIEIHVHPVDFDAVRTYYAERGVHEPRLVLVPAPERWISDPQPTVNRDIYAELNG
jgi:hypothetical protein